MRKFLLLLAFPFAASAADVRPQNEWTPSWQKPEDGFAVKNNSLGSGTPAKRKTEGTDVAAPVADGYYHVPGFLPGHPTATTLWPRVQTVDCDKVGEKIVCDGYQVNQAMGRGEYVYIQPNVKETPVVATPPTLPPLFTPVPENPVQPKPKKPRKPKPKVVVPPAICK